MVSNKKYRVNNLAKDLDMKTKDLVDFLAKCGMEGKTSTAIITPEEFAILLDKLTLENQTTNMASYVEGNVYIPKKTAKPAATKSADTKPTAAKEAPKKAENNSIEKKEDKEDMKTPERKEEKKTPKAQERKENVKVEKAPEAKTAPQPEKTPEIKAEPKNEKAPEVKPTPKAEKAPEV